MPDAIRVLPAKPRPKPPSSAPNYFSRSAQKSHARSPAPPPPYYPRSRLIQRKSSRHAADAIGAKQRALPSFHFCGDRQDAITTVGVTLILQETAVLFAADGRR